MIRYQSNDLMKRFAITLCALLIASGFLAAQDEQSLRDSHRRSAWLADGSYGLMIHYLVYPKGKTLEEISTDLNRLVDQFDLSGFMKQFDASGADWLIFTIGQNSGYYCSPNEYLDRRLPGRTSRRDLLMEIAREVKKRPGKHFVAYLPSEVGSPSAAAMNGLRNVFGWPPTDSTFRKNYCEFIRDYSVKLGKLCDGWWYDGATKIVDVPERFGDFSDWLAASRAGNPDAVVAFNAGPSAGAATAKEDYIAGETFELPAELVPAGQYVDDVQYHALLPIDSRFTGSYAHHYSDRYLFDWFFKVKAAKGAVTFNVPTDLMTGIVNPATIEQLQRLHAALAAKPSSN